MSSEHRAWTDRRHVGRSVGKPWLSRARFPTLLVETDNKEASTMPPTAASTVLGIPAPDFRLPATDGRTYALQDIAGLKGTVIAFICNQCPFVKAVIDRLVMDAMTGRYRLDSKALGPLQPRGNLA